MKIMAGEKDNIKQQESDFRSKEQTQGAKLILV